MAYNKEYYQANRERICAERRAHRVANPEKERASGKKWYNANKERKIATSTAWKLANPQKVKAINRKTRYGITARQFDIILENQGYVCAVCHKPEALNVDHNHTTGKVRGLLRRACNHAAGNMLDSPNLCLALANYLDWHEFTPVIQVSQS